MTPLPPRGLPPAKQCESANQSFGGKAAYHLGATGCGASALELFCAMARDQQIEAIFTTADDQMQGLWGLHSYLKAATDITSPEKLIPYLPQGVFRLTHYWVRGYDPDGMVWAMSDTGIDFLLSRSSLVSLATAGSRFSMRVTLREA